MPKKLGGALALLILSFGLPACSGKKTVPASLAPSTEAPIPLEEESFAPLTADPMPENCQVLLDKTSEWGYKLDTAWAPKDREQAEGALAFFNDFYVVPESSAKVFDRFSNRQLPKTDDEAEANILEFQKAQICHPSLVIAFVDGLFDFSWQIPADAEKLEATWKTFIQNQQNRTAPILVRALELQVLKKAIEKKWLKPKKSFAKSFNKDLERAQTEILAMEAELQAKELDASPVALESLLRTDLDQSEKIQKRIAKLLNSLR